jgi:hypothetical protein
MYFVTVAGSAAIVMVAAFIMNAVLNEGWLSRERPGQTEASSGPELGRTQAHRNEATW